MTHQAEDSQKHIAESGENANGRWIRFSDGTQICYASITIPYLNANNLRYTWYFPVPFVKVPSVSGGQNLPPDGKRTDIYPYVSVTRDYMYVAIYSYEGIFTSGDTAYANPLAIGRWKE